MAASTIAEYLMSIIPAVTSSIVRFSCYKSIFTSVSVTAEEDPWVKMTTHEVTAVTTLIKYSAIYDHTAVNACGISKTSLCFTFTAYTYAS